MPFEKMWNTRLVKGVPVRRRFILAALSAAVVALVWSPIERMSDARRAQSIASFESVLPPSDPENGFVCLLRYREPLYVVDGQELSPAAANRIVPEAIESIELMDNKAAGAVYGIRARVGVVLIATRAKRPPAAR
ncbi:MAG: hypothetical protein IPJ78_17235 [Gemmatimonadetes bacterium]|nr:hypothetical protein [Gemmatimonadota bacterium]